MKLRNNSTLSPGFSSCPKARISAKANNRIKRMLAIPLALLLAGTAAWAGDITAVAVTPPATGISTPQGTTLDGFTAEITGASGMFGSHTDPNPVIRYCSQWTLNFDGTTTCDVWSALQLSGGVNYTTAPPDSLPIKGDISVIVDGQVPCNRSYPIQEIFTAPTGAGTDFGSGIQTETVTFNVFVTCNTSAATGCSAGFWRNNASKWPSQDLLTTTVGSIFTGFSDSLSSETLLNALKSPGGGSTLADKENILLYQAVAAYLNAQETTAGGLNFPLASSVVVMDVNTALSNASSYSDSSYLTTEATTLDTDNNLGGSYCSDSTD